MSLTKVNHRSATTRSLRKTKHHGKNNRLDFEIEPILNDILSIWPKCNGRYLPGRSWICERSVTVISAPSPNALLAIVPVTDKVLPLNRSAGNSDLSI